ncbi:uncharacterized protein [Diadema antillarum]|uniref:uncharacterized protein n=1 Tax=Diadema antillarum TaxID=105358 RepID=UPI003A87714C
MGIRRLICCGRRSRSAYLCALLVLAVVYFIFQGTSLRALNNNNSAEISKHVLAKKAGSKVTEKKSKLQVIGVRTDDLIHYAPDKDGLFHCIDGSDKIPMAQVNDEYCDCPSDGSDEPGTDACPNSRFFCEQENQFLPSGKVNDGICDCCDGSDEWQASLSAAKVKGFPLSDAIQHTPCVDLCSKVADRQREERRVRQIGSRIKQQYIERARGHNLDGTYGKQGEFYQLSQECYDHADHSAVYKICPFQRVEQTQKGHMFRLGQGGGWDRARSDGKQVLVMEGGDVRGCTEEPRRTEIEFSCGLTNTVVSLKEEEKCVYIVEFLSPAAC